MMTNLEAILKSIFSWISHPLISIGEIEITVARIFGLLLIIIAAWWGSSALEKALRQLALRNTRLSAASSTVYIWARVLRYTVWIFGTIIGLHYIGFNLTNFALIGGAIGVGIGFGLQTIFSNLISGIILLVEKTLKLGDFVDLQSGVRGHVREIGLRYTRINTNDGVDIIIPNSEFINGRVVNWTFDNRLRRMRIAFGVAYGSDKLKVREAALKAARSIESTYEDNIHKSDVWLVSMGESSLDFVLAVWVGPDFVSRPANTEARYLWAIHDELLAAGLDIPFPQRDLHVRSGTLNVRIDKAE
jgi:small-conductance mechanosensitive channel